VSEKVEGLVVGGRSGIGKKERKDFKGSKTILKSDKREFKRVFLSVSLRVGLSKSLLVKELVELKIDGDFTKRSLPVRMRIESKKRKVEMMTGAEEDDSGVRRKFLPVIGGGKGDRTRVD